MLDKLVSLVISHLHRIHHPHSTLPSQIHSTYQSSPPTGEAVCNKHSEK